MANIQAPANPTLTNAKTMTATDIVRAILAPIASLKLTVFLLVMAVFVTWVITLEQVSLDIWALKHKHFNNFFVYVPLTTFFPLNWFPNGPKPPGGILLPSGRTIIAAMLINLTAAHVLRFRIRASGGRLLLGLLVLLASGFLTWAVIFNYQDADGFGGQPPIPWESMWTYLQIAVFGLGIASVYSALTVDRPRIAEKIVYWLFAATLFGLLALSLIFGDEAFIGDSAMRILWQLFQSTIAALAVLAGCVLLFKRKAGIVLLHLGIAGLLLNEIFVTVTNEEHRVSFGEGETVNHAIDLRETEFVVIDRKDAEFDEITVLPVSVLTDTEDQIDDERLPFKVQCVDFYPNSDVIQVGPHAENQADAGFGTRWIATPKKSSAGTDVDASVDKSSAYVKLIDRESNEPIGTYLVSQLAYEQSILDTVSIDDQDYQIGLRFKTIYTPYSLTLKDTQAKYYVGTQTPSWFSSDFVIDDPTHGLKTDQRIWMNNPLRYRDQTFYQVVYQTDQEGNEYSGIQIVRNRGWMIPYVCCMFVVVGLVAQFQQSLSTYLGKPVRTEKELESSGAAGKERSWGALAPTLVLLGIFGMYVGSKLSRSISPTVTKSKSSEIRLDLLGQIPVTHEGRVQPLDSFARNLSRRLSNREEVADGLGVQRPAIRWLADMLFDAPAADDFEILRIEDLNVQNALGLKVRKGLKFTFAEVIEADPKLHELLTEASKVPTEQRTVLQKRLREVYGKSRRLMGVRTALFGSQGRGDEDDWERRLNIAELIVDSKETLPFTIPTEDEDEPWLPLSLLAEQNWLAAEAKKSGSLTVEDLAEHFIKTDFDADVAKLDKQSMAQRYVIIELLSIEDVAETLSKQFKLEDPKEIADIVLRNWESLPKELYENRLPAAEQFVEMRLERLLSSELTEKQPILAEQIRKIVGDDLTERKVDPKLVDNLLGLKQAYLDGDAAGFNSAVETHLEKIAAIAPSGWNERNNKTEIAYNHFSPFYMAKVLYLVGFLITIFSWIGWRMPLNRAAFWIIVLALTVHFGGVAARVVISGRPPITNLYSSFVVVAACCVLLLLIIEYATRIGLGNLLAAASGFLTLLYAWTLSIDQGDTFTVLRAVLDTQFWLTTHVIIINLGYAATLVAGLMGVGFLFRMFFNSKLGKTDRRQFANIIYGTVCFALLFSFFGTVLGGLWGDDSWGRFWGWDPKENGALMIVLWNAVILHARWAGIIRERGLAALAAFGNIIVIWSWEGVNQLGVGLHAYAGVSAGGSTGSIFMEPLFYLKLFVVFHVLTAFFALIIPASWYRGLSDGTASAA